MQIEIKEVQEVVNGEAKPKQFTVLIKREYGTGDIHWCKTDWLYSFDLEDMKELAQKLSDTFCPRTNHKEL